MRFAVIALAFLALAAPALASEEHPTLAELESEVICPTCESTLDQSNSPIADRMRQYISERIAAGDTKSEIKDKLVEEFGPAVLASPPKEGFNLLAWVLPFAGLGVGAVVVGLLAWRWSRRRDPEPTDAPPPLDADLERRVDDALARYDQ